MIATRIPSSLRGPVWLFLIGIAPISCAPLAQPRFATSPAATALQSSVSDRLHFGRATLHGGMVSEANWTEFLREFVTPRFPAGLTVWRAEGQWRGSSGEVLREESFVLELIHADTPASHAAVEQIIAEYKLRFQQEAVLRVQNPVQISY